MFDSEDQLANYWGRTGIQRAWPTAWRGFPFLLTGIRRALRCATLFLGERLEPSLFLAMTLIIGGIALGTIGGGSSQVASSAKV
jgi:hypothetical protein